ncbi:MAG: hypothetical protein OXD44_05260 [Gammaproteobacteria bacterium]|nr:hypothetical protein [Gammaproteobacteria bacterium]
MLVSATTYPDSSSTSTVDYFSVYRDWKLTRQFVKATLDGMNVHRKIWIFLAKSIVNIPSAPTFGINRYGH